jgi:hypothetical protein
MFHDAPDLKGRTLHLQIILPLVIFMNSTTETSKPKRLPGPIWAWIVIGVAIVIVLLPNRKGSAKLNPPQSNLGKVEASIDEVAGSTFYHDAVGEDGAKLPMISDSTWSGEKAIRIDWLWDTHIAADTDWLIGQMKKVVHGVAAAPESANYKSLELHVYCELKDQYGKSHINQCGRFVVPIIEIKKVQFENIMNQDFAKFMNNQAWISIDSGAMKTIWPSR